MKKASAIVALLVTVGMLTGCTVGVAGPVEPSTSVEPVIDPHSWSHDETYGDFVDAFPDFDPSPLAHLDLIAQNNNSGDWLFSGAGGFEVVLEWTRDYATMIEDPNSDGHYSGFVETDDRAILFNIQGLNDDGAFSMLITSQPLPD